MIKFMNDVIVKASKTIRKNIKEEKGVPTMLVMMDSNGNSHKLSKKEVAGIFEARNVFILKKGRLPNYVTLNSTANNPLVMDYQNNKYNCCPTSLSMAIQMLYSYKSENVCAKALKTNTTGTAPLDLVSGAKNLGYEVKRISRNKASVKAQLNMGKSVIAHIQTKSATCLGYVGDYGHYVLIYGMSSDNYKIADPTKGIKTCRTGILDKATNGREIHYYSVSPL